MANKLPELPELCLRLIFDELKNDFISLHSCALVNRNWCVLALPKLWKNPFDDINNSNISGMVEANIPLMNTYTSCLPEDIRNNLGLKSVIKYPFFDYGTFIQSIHFKTIIKSIHLWRNLYKECGDPIVFKLRLTTKRRKLSINIEENILKALCEYFINRSTRIKEVKLLDDTFLNVFEFPSAALNLSGINYFKFEAQYNLEIILSAAKIAKNINKLEIDLKKVLYSTLITRLNNIKQLIECQKRLNHISLSCTSMEFIEILEGLTIHVENLTHITIRNIRFDQGFPFLELGKYLNLRYLEIENCKFNRGKIMKPNSNGFQKLESILISASYLNFEIMETLCYQAKDCLRIMKLPAGATDFPKLENIYGNFCPNIKKFITSIKKSSCKNIISMINACKSLEEIHIYEDKCDEIFMNNDFDANQFLRLLGEALPKSVHTFKYLSDLSFDSTSLETFLRQFQPKKFMLLEFHDCSFFSNEHLSAIINFCGKTMEKLHIIGANNLDHMYVLERKHQFLGELYVEKLYCKGLFLDD